MFSKESCGGYKPWLNLQATNVSLSALGLPQAAALHPMSHDVQQVQQVHPVTAAGASLIQAEFTGRF